MKPDSVLNDCCKISINKVVKDQSFFVVSKTTLSLAIFISFFSTAAISQNHHDKLKLWYTTPANYWVEALPLGNGRIGAMVYGNPANEKIQLNENTFWAGSPYRNDNLEASKYLPKIRKLIFDGNYGEAEKLANEKIISQSAHGMPYQPIGNINLHFSGHENFTEFYRELDLERAIATTRYKVEGVLYKREIFTSFADQVVVVKLTADQSGTLSFILSANRAGGGAINVDDKNKLVMSGISSSHEGVVGKVKFYQISKVLLDGGKMTSSKDSIFVSHANSATIVLSIATNFKSYQDLSVDPKMKAERILGLSLKKNYTQLINRHIMRYKKMFDRVKIELGSNLVNDVKPTDIRIRDFASTNDPKLASLYFQFGRYLLISSSQPGGQPANLQGIWNDQLLPAWDSKYTVNINTEMNYWPAELTNLSETSEPLIKMLHELSVTGKQTAHDMYNARGWVMHHNTDLWRFTGAIDGTPGLWPTGAAWLSQQLWKKYEYNGNINFLREVYPIIKEASLFFVDFLIKEPTNGWLVVSPSVSPENAPYSIRKKWICIAAGTTLDNLLVFDLFSKTIRSAALLNVDKDFADTLKSMIDKLPPLKIGKYGQLQEWLEDWDNPEDHHRHVSHLYGVYPGNQISPFRTPELFQAARKSLIYRGDASTGWSMGWKMNLWARFLDGNHAYKLLTDQLKLIEPQNQSKGASSENGGTYPNLFDVCPPFQIDGNFGCTAGIAEMLLQSHDGFIFPIPALPDQWKNGSVSGLKALGGFEISMDWHNGELTKLIIKSNLGGNCRIRLKSYLTSNTDQKLTLAQGVNPNNFYAVSTYPNYDFLKNKNLVNTIVNNSSLYDFETQAGKVYVFKFLK